MTGRQWGGVGGLIGAAGLASVLILSGGTVVSPPGRPPLNPQPVTSAVLDATVAAANGLRPASVQQVGGYVSPAFTLLRAVEIDSGNGVVIVDSAHHEQHEGMGFSFTDASTSLGAAGVRNILVIVGVGAVHFVPRVDASLSGLWTLYEAPTCAANGTGVTVRNRFLGSANASTTTVFHTPTCAADGTPLEWGQVGGGGSSNRIGAQTGSRYEWILQPGTKYLFRFVADANSTRTIMGGEWYQAHDANGGHVL